MKYKKLNIGTILIVWLFLLFPSKLISENPEWMYFHELADVRGLEPIGDYIYIGLSWPGLGIRRLSLETLELDTIEPIIYANSFAEDSKGVIWFATVLGLWEYKDNSIVNKYDHTNSNLKMFHNGPDVNIWSIAIDKQDNKWLGTDTALIKFDGIEFKYFKHTYQKDNTLLMYQHILFDRDKTGLWISGNSIVGILYFSQEQFTVYNNSNSKIGIRTPDDFDIDKLGNIWIVGYIWSVPNSGKLVKFDGENWDFYDTEDSTLAKLYVTSIKIDDDDTKWLGTALGGLIKYDGSEWKQFNKSNSGISHNLVNKIKIDKYGNKWIVTPSGIHNFFSLEVFREGGVLLPTNVKELIRKHDEKIPLVYPNPAQDIIKVSDLIKRERTYTISNIYGQVLMEGTFFHEINISSLPSGFYLLKVNDKFLKFIKIDSKN